MLPLFSQAAGAGAVVVGASGQVVVNRHVCLPYDGRRLRLSHHCSGPFAGMRLCMTHRSLSTNGVNEKKGKKNKKKEKREKRGEGAKTKRGKIGEKEERGKGKRNWGKGREMPMGIMHMCLPIPSVLFIY